MAKANKKQTKTNQKAGWLVNLANTTLSMPLRTLMAVAGLLLLGLASWFYLLPREGFPNVASPIIFTRVNAPGLDAEKVDNLVAQPLNNIFQNDLSGLKKVNSTSFPNGASLVANFGDQTDMSVALDNLNKSISSLNLPKNIRVHSIIIDPSSLDGKHQMILAVAGGQDISDLHSEATQVAASFKNLPNIQQAEIIRQLDTLPSGQTVQTSFSKYGQTENNQPINIKDTYLIGLNATAETDTKELSKIVRNHIKELKLRDGYEVLIAADFAPQIDTQINNLMDNLASGLLAVIAITLLLIAIRASLVVAIFIPAVITVSFGVMWLIGYSINTISLFALVLALGLFVDDATIVVEAAERASRNKDTKNIAKTAVQRVAMASLAGTLTTVLVFLPLAFVSGIIGGFMRALPITISIALVVSLLLSLLAMPILLNYVFGRKKRQPWFLARWINLGIDKLASGLNWFYRRLAAKKPSGILAAITALLISLAVIGAGVQKFRDLSFNIFPNVKDADAMAITLRFPPNTDLQTARQITDQANQKITESLGKNISDILYYTGNARVAEAYVRLVPYGEREITAPQLAEQLQNNLTTIKGIRSKVEIRAVGPPTEELPFKMQIYSDDQQKSLAAASQVTGFLKDRTINRANGEPAKVTDVKITSLGTLSRQNNLLYAQIGASFDADDTSALVEATKAEVQKEFNASKIESFGLSAESFEYDFGFESENQNSFSSLMFIMPLAIVIMYALLAFQFRSLMQPLLIFLAIPFSIFGMAYGLALSGHSISFFSMIGFMGLIGISVNNTILLVDYANQARRRGLSATKAISEATRLRLRPLLTTTITTVVALAPLALANPFWQPLAVTIMFGLLSSTLLIILAFPYYYLGAYWLTSRFKKLKNSD